MGNCSSKLFRVKWKFYYHVCKTSWLHFYIVFVEYSATTTRTSTTLQTLNKFYMKCMTIHFSIGSIILLSSSSYKFCCNLQTKDINIIINDNTYNTLFLYAQNITKNSLNLFYNSMNLLQTSFRVKLFEL